MSFFHKCGTHRYILRQYVEFFTYVLLSRQSIDVRCGGDILKGDAYALVKSDIVRELALRRIVDNDIRQVIDFVPIKETFIGCDRQVTGLHTGLLASIGHDEAPDLQC